MAVLRRLVVQHAVQQHAAAVVPDGEISTTRAERHGRDTVERGLARWPVAEHGASRYVDEPHRILLVLGRDSKHLAIAVEAYAANARCEVHE